MFTTYFKMTRHPFCERTPINQILKDERISQGLARLEYLAQEELKHKDKLELEVMKTGRVVATASSELNPGTVISVTR